MSFAVGIDLGTTNSVVSIFRRGVAETLNVDGRSMMPSVVSFRSDGSALVGQAAKARLMLDPENTVASAKRFMGDRSKTYQMHGRWLRPIDISSLVLRRLVEAARQTLGQDIWDAVITVPAYFTEVEREDTKRAGEEAGLNVLRLLPEPTSAAIAYGLDKGKDQTILVYDLGGGTFDVSILTVRGNEFEVKAVGGDRHLGGDDFDLAIMSWAAEAFRKETGLDLMGDRSREANVVRQRLKEAAEAVKIELSQSENATLAIPDCMGRPLEMELTLADYNKLIEPLLQRTVYCILFVLREAGMGPDDIGRVILVGGSTKNRAVRELVARELKEPYISERVDEVVSHGAAILAANLSLPEEQRIVVKNVAGHSLGIDMLNDSNELEFKAIIPRQTEYPCRRGVLGTARPMQDHVEIKVFRGEDRDPRRNEPLGELSMPISPPQNKIVPVVAIFELDEDGIIHFTAVQLPFDARIEPIIRYWSSHNELDIAAVDALLKDGITSAKTVTIKAQLPEQEKT